MVDWTGYMVMIGFGLLTAFLAYIVIRMLVNRIMGRDELDNLFNFKIKFKNKRNQ